MKQAIKFKGIREMLTRDQMKEIKGGVYTDEISDGGGCVCLPLSLSCGGGDPLKRTACYSSNFGNGITCCGW